VGNKFKKGGTKMIQKLTEEEEEVITKELKELLK